jgi:hypothetical protein
MKNDAHWSSRRAAMILAAGLLLPFGCIVTPDSDDKLDAASPEEVADHQGAFIEEPCQQQARFSDGLASGCEACGDGYCSASESYDTCPYDCGFCGDGVCSATESGWCASDCDWCGDGSCNGGDSTANCPQDCGSACWDGVCNGAENAANCPAECSLPTTLTVEKVRYCKWSFPVCNSAITRPEYGVWESNGVDNEKQKRTFLSRASDPLKSKVRHLMFIAAGQQTGDFPSDDVSTLLTGQSMNWNQFSSTQSTRQVTTDPDSLARRVVATGRWPISNTFIGLAFDARFNFDFGAAEKNDIEDAYFAWLTGKFFAGNLEGIYLAGYSRGGCLVARLARRFKQSFPSVPLVLHIFDGVCAEHSVTHPWDGPEFGLLNRKEDNPENSSDYSAWKVDMNERFPDRTNLSVLNMVGGEKVLLDAARAFSHVDASANPTELFLGPRAWYRQTWHDASHGAMDNASRVTDAVNHFVQSCNALGC